MDIPKMQSFGNYTEQNLNDKVISEDLSRILFYNGSDMIVEFPKWDYKKPGKERETREFGEGFYTSYNDRNYPIYLRSDLDKIILNKYYLNMQGLNILRLKDDLKWLLIIAFHRSSFSRRPKFHRIRDSVRNYVSEFDLIIGTISDDRLFSAVDFFLADASTDFVTIELARMFKLGTQYVSKSNKSDKRFRFAGFEDVSYDEILIQRKLRESHRADMAESVAIKRAELHPIDTGKLFSNLMEEIGGDLDAWLRV